MGLEQRGMVKLHGTATLQISIGFPSSWNYFSIHVSVANVVSVYLPQSTALSIVFEPIATNSDVDNNEWPR
jgi:hypothetical protein